ncbi:hypothetical protein TI05_04280 [Achromatium sp. WMS3]|nr:hypothetical protein TI05_04280 [Achromatium sp. WMS3]
MLEARDVSRGWIESLQHRNFDDTINLRWLYKSDKSPKWDQILANKKIVCAHLYSPKVRFNQSVIRLDTSGGYESNPISAVLLPNATVYTSTCSSAITLRYNSTLSY